MGNSKLYFVYVLFDVELMIFYKRVKKILFFFHLIFFGQKTAFIKVTIGKTIWFLYIQTDCHLICEIRDFENVV
jgi:hypothetical protein